MKNYLELNTNAKDALKEFTSDAAKILCGKTITSNNEELTIIDVPMPEDFEPIDDYTILVKSADNKEKELYTNTAIQKGTIVFSEDLKQQLADFETAIKQIYEQVKVEQQAQKEIELQQMRERQAARLALEKETKLEQKREAIKNSNLKLAEKVSEAKIDAGDEFYYAIGYLAKHSKNITAAMPDYLEDWFVKEFGDVKRRVMDQSILSPSGLPAQYAFYLKMELDTNKNIPYYLLQHLGDVKQKVKPISDTPFTACLIRDYGFKVGKVQDINEIMSNIPDDSINAFKLGLNA